MISAAISAVVTPGFLNEHQIPYEETLKSLEIILIKGLKE